jgi:hypothetical protein
MAKEKNLLDGVVKFVAAEGFATFVADRLAACTQAACEKLNVPHENLPRMLDQQVYALLFTCVLEDLMTRALPDGRNLTDAYVKRHGWKLGTAGKRALEAVRDSRFGMYEIIEVTPGVGMVLKDLVDNFDPVQVEAPSLSGALPVGCPLGARVMRAGGMPGLTGGILPFEVGMSAEAAEAVRGSDDPAAAITNFWLLKTLQEQLGQGGAESGTFEETAYFDGEVDEEPAAQA